MILVAPRPRRLNDPPVSTMLAGLGRRKRG